jgi:hypothetical protein
MRLKKERIAILAKNIVEGLIDKKYVNPLISKGDFITKIENTITEEMLVEDRLNEEVREILKTHSKQIEQGSINYNKMFQMIKNKLIQERGIII